MLGSTSAQTGQRFGTGFAVLTLFGVLFLASADNQLLIPLLPALSAELGVSIARLGGLFSVYALSAALLNLVFGPLTDRLGRVLFLRLGLGGFALLAFVTTQVETFYSLMGLRAATGVAAGLLSTCTASYVGDAFPVEKRGRVMGIVLSSYFAALILGIPISSWIAESWGWKRVYFVSSILASLLFAAACRLASDRKAEDRQDGRKSKSLLALVLGRETGAALATSFLVSGGTLAFLTYISGYLSETFQLRPVQISMVFLVSGGAALLVSPFSGWISDRHRARLRVFAISNSLLAIPLLLLVHLGCGFWLFFAIFAASLCVSFRQTALQTLQTELVTTERRGSFLAMRNCASQLGISASVFLAGGLYENLGYGAVTAFAAILMLAGSAILYFFVDDPARRAS